MPDPSLERLRGLESHLAARLRGQDRVLARLAPAFLRGELNLTAPGRPRGSFLLVGPTGCGKTELTLLCGDYLFGANRVCRFDLSEFARDDAVARFLGENSADPGAFGRALAGRDRGILLFDEIEKAHGRLWDLFLQLLEPGHLTLATGAQVSVRNFYLVFNSNLGGAEAVRMTRSTAAGIEHAVLRRLEQQLRPEFVGRIAEKLVFAPLAPATRREICTLCVAAETARLRGLGHDLQVSNEALEFLLREGFHPHLGARPLRAAVERHLQHAVVESLLARGSASGPVVVSARAGLTIAPG
jgi:ATP-dependent Clp protease ATP-binding subunit ClpB